MSGFEVVGVILGLYPIIGTVLKAYKASKGGKGAQQLIRVLKVEELIFGEFVHHLLAPNVSEAELVLLKASSSHDPLLWTNAAASMTRRLGLEKARLIVEILQEMCILLRSLQGELSTNTHGKNRDYVIEVLRRFHDSVRNVKQSLPQSNVKEGLDELTAYNVQLQRLFADRSLPSNRARAIHTQRYLRKDINHVIDLYNAICSGYRCDCDAPHFANFGLPRIPDIPDDNKSSTKDQQFELLFPSDQPEVKKSVNDVTINNIRRISICQCDDHRSDELNEPNTNLCILVRTFDQHLHVSNTRLGILRLEKKLYELQVQNTSKNIVSLDNLLTNPNSLLSRRDRITLALRLSYAILQIYSTPWIEACWTWGDFCMDKQNDLELFVTSKFYSACSGSTSSDISPISEFWVIRGEPILTRLGYALIELALGKRLAQLRKEDQYSSKDPDIVDYLTAKGLVESGCIMGAEGRVYENVVKACLYHQFLSTSDLKVIDSSLISFHEDVERSIIGPLHKMWITAWGDS